MCGEVANPAADFLIRALSDGMLFGFTVRAYLP